MHKTLSQIISALLFLFCSSAAYACNNAPVAHMILPTIDPAHVAGKTMIYDSFGTDIDGDAIVAYLWTFPDEAYCVTGENTAEPTCKYSPESSEYTCTLSLKVKDSTGLWSVLEEVNITVAPLASAATWYVSTEGDNLNDGRSEIPEIDNWLEAFRDIQVALETAVTGDMIIVAEGTYYENIQFRGHDIEVISASGIAGDVTIYGDGLSPVVSFEGKEGSVCKLTGITIRSDDVPMPGAIAYWKLDAAPSGNTTDDSTTPPYDATVVGITTVETNGKVDKAFSFNGNGDYLTADSVCAAINGGDITFACWVKSQGFASGQQFVSAFNASNGNNLLLLGHPSGNSNLNMHQNGWHDTGVVVFDDRWHHVAYTFSGADDMVWVYVDGNEAYSFSVDANLSIDNGDLFSIGQEYDNVSETATPSDFFHGLIDDVRIYNSVLSAVELFQIYKNTASSLTEGTVAYWKLDEDAEATTAYDCEGNEMGTLAGGPTWLPTGGKFGGALDFDGSGDFVEINQNAQYTEGVSLDEYSISLWFKTGLDTVDIPLFTDAHTAYQESYGRPHLSVRVDKVMITGGDSAGKVYSGLNMANDQWHHVVGTVNAITDGTQLYVDGVYCGSRSDYPAYPLDFSYGYNGIDPSYMDNVIYNRIEIGGRSAKGKYFSGSIDDVRVYNRVLNAAEISHIHRINGGGIDGGKKNIYGEGTEATISNCVIINNTASQFGGIYNCDGIITGCTITGNTATEGDGGGLSSCDGTITNCTISGNTADQGGGISNSYGDITGCTISGNTATEGDGGGLYRCDGTITNCTISDNTASMGDGGGFWSDIIKPSGSEPTDLVHHWKLAGDATDSVTSGGVNGTMPNGDSYATDYYRGNVLSLDGIDDYVQMTGYTGITGGYARTCSAWIKTTTVDDEIISWGDLSDYGSKWIVRTNSDGTLRAEVKGGYAYGTTFISDGQWHHVAVVLPNDGTPNTEDIQFYVDGNLDIRGAYSERAINTASSDPVRIGVHLINGTGRFFNGSISDVRIYDRALIADEITYLYASERGEAPATITNCTITGNTATNGGGMYGCDGEITNCTISGNTAEYDGGALYDCDGPIDSCIITYNTAGNTGGGLYECDGTIENSVIVDNNAFPGLIESYQDIHEDEDGVDDLLDDYPFDGSKVTWPVVAEFPEDGSDSEQDLAMLYPLCITGSIGKDGDEDFYKFNATKGEVITVIVEYSGQATDFTLSVLSLNQIGNEITPKGDWNQDPYVSAISLMVVKDQISIVVRGDNLKGDVDLPYTLKVFNDQDADGVDDDKEQAMGMDRQKQDADGDGIPDIIELIISDTDIDSDGIPNWLDQDTDGDGILDHIEGYKDIDGDGLGDFADTDSDNNGILDEGEPTPIDLDTDSDGIYDYADTDDDDDGILDLNDDDPLVLAPQSYGLIYNEGTGDYSVNADDVSITTLVVDFGNSRKITNVVKTGDTLIVNGSGFGATDENLVIFAGQNGPINVTPTVLESGTRLSVVVPDEITIPTMLSLAKDISGSYIRSSAHELEVLDAGTPVLYEPDFEGTINPPHGEIGHTVTFYGVGLGNVDKVNFNGIETPVSNITSTQFDVLIPNNANSGELTVLDQLGRKSNVIFFGIMKVPGETAIELPTDFPQIPAEAYPKLTVSYGVEDEALVDVDGTVDIMINDSSLDVIHVFYEEILGAEPYNGASFLQAIVLPDDENVRINTKSTAVSHVFMIFEVTIDESQFEDILQIIGDLPEIETLAETIKDGLNCDPYFMVNPDPGNVCQQECYLAYQEAFDFAVYAADTAITEYQTLEQMAMSLSSIDEYAPIITPSEQQDISVFAHYEDGKNIGVENDTKLYLSTKIIDSLTEQVLQEHVDSFYNKNIVGPQGGWYSALLIAKRKEYEQPQGKNCKVEVLTGGSFVVYPALTASEKEVQSNLQFKTLLGGVIIPPLQIALGSAAKTLDASFVEKLIIKYNPALSKIVCEMIDSGDEIGAAKKLVIEFSKEFNPASPGPIVKEILMHYCEKRADAALAKLAAKLGSRATPALGQILAVLDAIKLANKGIGFGKCIFDMKVTDTKLTFDVQWPGVIDDVFPNKVRDDGIRKQITIKGVGLSKIGDIGPVVKFSDEYGGSIIVHPLLVEGGDEMFAFLPSEFLAGKVGAIEVQVIIGEVTINAPEGEEIYISDEIIIDYLCPDVGNPGEKIQIVGSGFSETLDENRVTFQGHSGRLDVYPIGSSEPPNILHVYAPEDVVTGYVQVDDGTRLSNVNIVFTAGVYISTINPSSGRSGDFITLDGNGFTSGEIEYIDFKRVDNAESFIATDVYIISDSRLVVEMHENMLPGNYHVWFKVEGSSQVSSGLLFTISAVEIESIWPEEQWPNETITIYGLGFDIFDETNNIVTFSTASGATNEMPISVEYDWLNVVVPADAVTGPVTVAVDGVTSNSKELKVKNVQAVEYFRYGDPSLMKIVGQNFSIYPWWNVVYFPTNAGEIGVHPIESSFQGDWLEVIIPPQAIDGDIYIDSSHSGIGNVTTNYLPFVRIQIDSLNPDTALVGDPIRINGEGFSDIINENTVTFSEALDAVITGVGSNGEWLDVIVPDGTESGPVTVTVEVNGNFYISNEVQFADNTPEPIINKIIPNFGHPGIPDLVDRFSYTVYPPVEHGSEVVICGFNFSSILDENIVKIGGHEAENIFIDIDADGWCKLHVYVPDALDPGLYDEGLEQPSMCDVEVVVNDKSTIAEDLFTLQLWYDMEVRFWEIVPWGGDPWYEGYTLYFNTYIQGYTKDIDEDYYEIVDTNIDTPFIVTHPCRFSYKVSLLYVSRFNANDSYKVGVVFSPWVRTASGTGDNYDYWNNNVDGAYSEDYTSEVGLNNNIVRGYHVFVGRTLRADDDLTYSPSP